MFTSSIEATHRLYLLLASLSCLAERVVEFSSLVPPAERAANLEAFRSGAAKVSRCFKGAGLVRSGAAKGNNCYNGAGAAQLECPSHRSWVARLAAARLWGARLFQPARMTVLNRGPPCLLPAGAGLFGRHDARHGCGGRAGKSAVECGWVACLTRMGAHATPAELVHSVNTSLPMWHSTGHQTHRIDTKLRVFVFFFLPMQNVVNYDAPVYVKTYVHRAGRTARAGGPGRGSHRGTPTGHSKVVWPSNAYQLPGCSPPHSVSRSVLNPSSCLLPLQVGRGVCSRCCATRTCGTSRCAWEGAVHWGGMLRCDCSGCWREQRHRWSVLHLTLTF